MFKRIAIVMLITGLVIALAGVPAWATDGGGLGLRITCIKEAVLAGTPQQAGDC